MKFSARVSYGLRAALALAEAYDQGPMLSKDLSEKEALPPAYLEQILASLRRADLVSGTRGARGGYMLTRDPRSITVTEIITALEGPLQLSDCPGGAACCDTPDRCVVSALFQNAEDALRQVLDATTLSDLVRRREELLLESAMYYI